jgi:NADH dehydrogenase
VPTFNRKVRVMADWMLTAVLRREVISLGQLQDPRHDFLAAATGGAPLPPPSAGDRAQAGGRSAQAS